MMRLGTGILNAWDVFRRLTIHLGNVSWAYDSTWACDLGPFVCWAKEIHAERREVLNWARVEKERKE